MIGTMIAIHNTEYCGACGNRRKKKLNLRAVQRYQKRLAQKNYEPNFIKCIIPPNIKQDRKYVR